MKFLRYFILMIGCLVSAQSYANPQCKFKGNEKYRSYSRLSTKLEGIPLGMATAVSLYYLDWGGLARLWAIEGVKFLAKEPLKHAINKRRPCGCEGAFPSGHAMLTMQGAAYLHYRYNWKIAAPAYLITAVTSYCRVKIKAHDWVDVIGSAAAINLLTYFVVPPYESPENKKRKKEEERVKWAPTLQVGKKQYLVGVTGRF